MSVVLKGVRACAQKGIIPFGSVPHFGAFFDFQCCAEEVPQDPPLRLLPSSAFASDVMAPASDVASEPIYFVPFVFFVVPLR